MSWVDAMTLDGLGVWITPDERVGIADRSSGWRWGPIPLRRRSRYLRIGDAHDTALAGDMLLVAQRISRPALAKLTAADIPWAVDDGRYRIDARHGHTTPLSSEAPPDRRSDPRAALALLQAEQPRLSQRCAAQLLGVSQPRVHRLRRDLAAAGTDPTSLEQLMALWHRSRHHPQGEVQHWVAEAPVWTQVEQAYKQLEAADHTPVLGGEAAADRLTAWTTPATAVIHAKGLRPLRAPFVPASSPDETTLTVEATRDPLVHALTEEKTTPFGHVRVAHPAIVARDLEPLARFDERVAETLERLKRGTLTEGARGAPR